MVCDGKLSSAAHALAAVSWRPGKENVHGCLQVLMATNRIDILDPALLRPGRIDRKIEFPNPNESSRADILRIHSRKMNLVRGIDLRKIADKMTGASGAELKVTF